MTPAAIIATAIVALAGNLDVFRDKAADATLTHALIVEMQADARAAHTGRHDLLERQKAFEQYMEDRLDELEADILIPDKEDQIPEAQAPRFEPPTPLALEPPPLPRVDAPKVNQLIE